MCYFFRIFAFRILQQSPFVLFYNTSRFNNCSENIVVQQIILLWNFKDSLVILEWTNFFSKKCYWTSSSFARIFHFWYEYYMNSFWILYKNYLFKICFIFNYLLVYCNIYIYIEEQKKMSYVNWYLYLFFVLMEKISSILLLLPMLH